MAFGQIPLDTPALVCDDVRLDQVLDRLDSLHRQADCHLFYSVKSLPLRSLLETIRPHVDGFSVSSLFEARLARSVLGETGLVTLTTPGIRPDEVNELASICDYLVCNSLEQFARFAATAAMGCSIGLRVNPGLSFADDIRYDPCRPFSKLGVSLAQLQTAWLESGLPALKGLHFHNAFSQQSFAPLLMSLDKLEAAFGSTLLPALDWINLGGGYLVDRIAEQKVLAERVRYLQNRYNLRVHFEPGKGVVGSSVDLYARVIDLFESDSRMVAVLDTSINHLPEVFEYQRQPVLREHHPEGRYPVLLAGCSCLAGDQFGEYLLQQPPSMGQLFCFPNTGAYTLVKANRFNGINLPAVYRKHSDGSMVCIKRYTYSQYADLWQ